MAFWNRWVAIRTEGGSRAELIDRLQAHLKAGGLKSKITNESGSLKRIHVLKKDLDQAKTLLETFDEEH
ncbi:hypothetical protein [Paenibacillus harenae]|uniref:DUF2007 domain-containing protein n=1 Tax=Paenibacillus harenae TaxID=306543 RepID=A0ABT9U1Q2_PAEHA|nr:hypothetical protein [Paenibacillus harenae]MDQ0061932.1 hypothetical protein [Paenibacillus harenae]MDQ0113556.1 hypothetical protein [Paenibacillus harenae]